MQSLMIRQGENNPEDGIRLLENAVDPTGMGFRMSKSISVHFLQWL